MKKFFIAAIISGFFVTLCSFPVFASLTSISASNPFQGPRVITDTDTFLHEFNFDNSNIEIGYFELVLQYSDVHSNTNTKPNSQGEQWYVTPESVNINTFLLIPTSANELTNQTFKFYENDLPDLFSQFALQSSFILGFTENTDGVDSFKLHSATLNIYGERPAVPIPGAALLLGPVLLGLVGIRRKLAA